MADASSSPRVGLITGANGITGSAILEYLVKTTDASQWSNFIVTSRSPLQLSISDPRISFIALDFTKSPAKLAPLVQDTCSSVTHAFFSSYIHKDDFHELNTANQALFENFLTTLVQVSPKLQNVTLQTGGKYYGVHLASSPSPNRESDSRIKPFGLDNFYFPQEDFLAQTAEGKAWSWNVIRPVAIIGTTPKLNGMSEAITLAVYMLTCKKLGEKPLMPTNEIYWNGFENVSDSKLIADLTIWASTTRKLGVKNEAFNVNNGEIFTWKWMWPRLTAFFGVETSPEQNFEKAAYAQCELGKPVQEFSFTGWATEDRKKAWTELCEENGAEGAKGSWDAASWQVMDWVYARTWCNSLSMSKARKAGWNGYKDNFESFAECWDRMREMGQLPGW